MTTVHMLLEDNNMTTSLSDDLEIPVLAGAQCQGDLIVAPTRPGGSARTTEAIPVEGVALVQGQGGHTHLLVGTGTWTPGAAGNADLGVLTVPDGGEAYLIHEEHGALGVAPGSYRIGRQEEMWNQLRVVAD